MRSSSLRFLKSQSLFCVSQCALCNQQVHLPPPGPAPAVPRPPVPWQNVEQLLCCDSSGSWRGQRSFAVIFNFTIFREGLHLSIKSRILGFQTKTFMNESLNNWQSLSLSIYKDTIIRYKHLNTKLSIWYWLQELMLLENLFMEACTDTSGLMAQKKLLNSQTTPLKNITKEQFLLSHREKCSLTISKVWSALIYLSAFMKKISF